ncbi:hypothetical protein SLS62_010066 [Diatrype stigma]|uniref:Arrestin C-terminal-like domain-containing protein n=1 Tax=Diatrype stigma TaxID=117547 RepID=A0AAN9UBU9_9PEZI
MPSFNPFTAVAGRNACTLFEIRLENDFIVFRGNEHEATGQILKGYVVLCLRESLKLEDIHLRLTGNCRLAWVEAKQTPTGIHNQKVDRSTCTLRHDWPPFVGDATHHHNTLAPGNYEWPFEYTLPGDTSESVEGLYQTGITYLIKATVSRGKLAKNLHAYKRVRIIRTLEPAALEFNHAMSVENIWPNKIEYSVVIPQKAIVFGTCIPLEMRFSPLLKGLEMGMITAKLIEIQELSVSSFTGASKSHKHERDVMTWTFNVDREQHWRDNIEETGQEGWALTRELSLPKKLSKCIQDCNVQGIKIRHKVKLTVALKNPDGHVSEVGFAPELWLLHDGIRINVVQQLRATLPVTIFISPNMPLDEEGNIVSQQPTTSGDRTPAESELSNLAPPGYGQHVLDQLYDDVDPTSIIPPSNMQSGINTPFYAQSRAGSSENLALTGHNGAVPPAALSSRLQNVSLSQSNRNSSFLSNSSRSGTNTPFNPHIDEEPSGDWSQPHSTELSRRTSIEDHSHSHSHSSTPPEPEHDEFLDLAQLSKENIAENTVPNPWAFISSHMHPMEIRRPNDESV